MRGIINSIRSFINDTQEWGFIDQLTEQHEWNTKQLHHDMRGIRAAAVDRGNSVPEPVRPSFASAAFRIGGAGVSAYGDYVNRQPRSGR